LSHPSPRSIPTVSLLAFAVIAASLAPRIALRAAGEPHLQVEPGFQARLFRSFSPSQFVGGLTLLADGRLAAFDGTSVVVAADSGAPFEPLYTPPDAPVFGSFLRPSPDGAALYFGLTRTGENPHDIYRIPLDGAGETKSADRIRFNFDMTFDDAGRAFISALEAGNENRIYLLDGDPVKPSDTVIVGIPVYSGPMAYRAGRLYYATASPAGGNQVVYFTDAQIEAGIGEGKEIQFIEAATLNQILVERDGGYFNLAFLGDDLYASDSFAGVIERILSDGTRLPFASAPLPSGGNGSVTFLAVRPGVRPFLAGNGPEGGAIFVSLTDFVSFNEIVEISAELHFRRGYVSPDPDLDLADAVTILDYLFLGGGEPKPLAAADLNDDAAVDISDPVFLLDYLFTGGPEPPEPFQVRGSDPTP